MHTDYCKHNYCKHITAMNHISGGDMGHGKERINCNGFDQDEEVGVRRSECFHSSDTAENRHYQVYLCDQLQVD